MSNGKKHKTVGHAKKARKHKTRGQHHKKARK